MKLLDWLRERELNARRIASGKSGADRAGWLEDADYFKRSADAVAELARLEHGFAASTASRATVRLRRARCHAAGYAPLAWRARAMSKSGLNYTGYPERAPDALEVLEILMRAYVPKNTTDANYCLAALNVLRRELGGTPGVALGDKPHPLDEPVTIVSPMPVWPFGVPEAGHG